MNQKRAFWIVWSGAIITILTWCIVVGPRTVVNGSESKIQMKDPGWEKIVSNSPNFYLCHRAKTPTGWIVTTSEGVAFIPDPNHEWLK